MKKFFLKQAVWVLSLLLAGLTQVVCAQEAQTDAVIITGDQNYEDPVHIKNLIIRNLSEDPTNIIDISFLENSTIETITVECGKAEILFTGAETVKYNLGPITIAGGAELTLSLGTPDQMTIESVINNGRFIDLTGSVQKVGGTHSFEIKQAEGFSKMGVLGIHSEIKKADLDPIMEVSLQKKEGDSWKDDPAVQDEWAESIGFSVSASGTYRLKWVYEADENNGYAELYSKEINLLQLAGNETLKDVHYNAIALNTGTIEPVKVSMDNVYTDPCTTEDKAAGFSVGLTSNLELTLTGTNSELGILRNHGTMVLKQEGNAQLANTTIYNEGTFTDETGIVGTKILGPAGLWVKEIKSIADITAPDKTQIKGMSLQYAVQSFFKKVIVETLQDGQWVDYNESKGSESGEASQTLRAAQEDETEQWTTQATQIFQTAVKGTYRFKIETTKDKSETSEKTTWYSKPFELIASEFEIKDDQLTMGEEDATTTIPSLLITAGQNGDEVKKATLNNIEISEHTDGTPSVVVNKGAKVDLTLEGTNNLGSIQLAEGSTITLMPKTAGEDMDEKLSISSVYNGGSFTDETGTVSLVKDLKNQTMIEFTDTVVYQIGDAISVTLRAVSNSLMGYYMLWGDHRIEKLEGNVWKEFNENKSEDAQSNSLLRAGNPVENPNHSTETVINLTTTEPGTYRMKVTAEELENANHNATLYFMFTIAKLENEIAIKTINENATIDGANEGDINMLLFNNGESTESPVQVTLNNIQLKEKEGYEEYTSSVVTKDQNYELTLNGDNDLAAFIVEEGATATLKKGDLFKSLNATVYNSGRFIDETGTIQEVVDLDGKNMLSITGYQLQGWNGYILRAYTDFFFGDYEVTEGELYHLVGDNWEPYHNSVMRSSEGTLEDSDPKSGEFSYTYTGLEAGEYRIKVYAEKWTDGAEFGQAKHSVTLYHYFTITEPEPEPSYYSVTLPSIEGATTSPAADTYWVIEGSSFSFSLTLDPEYDQSQPIVKVNGTEVTPDENGTYTIANIYEEISIMIEGVVENTPTDNAEVEADDAKVWAANGQLHLSIPAVQPVWIYAFNGSLIRSFEEVAGDITVSLNKGSYIIVVGEKRYKIAL